MIKDIEKSVARIQKAIEQQEKIIVFGDYDVVMDLMRDEMRKSYEQHGRAIFVCKFIEGNLDNSEASS